MIKLHKLVLFLIISFTLIFTLAHATTLKQGFFLTTMTEEEIEQLPKHGRMHNYDPPIGSALYFYSGDTQTELELQTIQESIVIK